VDGDQLLQREVLGAPWAEFISNRHGQIPFNCGVVLL
jgi:hypothetical protein